MACSALRSKAFQRLPWGRFRLPPGSRPAAPSGSARRGHFPRHERGQWANFGGLARITGKRASVLRGRNFPRHERGQWVDLGGRVRVAGARAGVLRGRIQGGCGIAWHAVGFKLLPGLFRWWVVHGCPCSGVGSWRRCRADCAPVARTICESSLVCLFVSLFVVLDFYIKKSRMMIFLDANIKCKPSKNSVKPSLRAASCWA